MNWKFYERVKFLFPLMEGEEKTIEINDDVIHRTIVLHRTRYSPNMFIKQFIEFPAKSRDNISLNDITIIDFIVFDGRNESLFPFAIDTAKLWSGYMLVPAGKLSRMDEVLKRMDMLGVELV